MTGCGSVAIHRSPERLAAYGEFVTALTQFRRGQLEWVNRHLEDPDAAVTIAARAEAYRRRGAAQAALSQVQLVAEDSGVKTAAADALEAAEPMNHAADTADLDARNEAAKASLEQFVTLASAEVQSGRAAQP